MKRIRVENSEKLYPKGIDWNLQSGVNALIGGTALGKTTLIYAIQFGIFGKLIVEGTKGNERIEKEFFRNRMSNRKSPQLERFPPTIEVWFSIGMSSLRVKRNLLTGIVVEAELDGELLRKIGGYQELLAGMVGLGKDFAGLARLQVHLLFFGEARYLVAWENLLQNELLNLIFADNDKYKQLADLWESAKSADSSARNLSAQAVRLEKDLKTAGIQDDPTRQLEVRSARNQVQSLMIEVQALNRSLESVRAQLVADRGSLSRQTETVMAAQIAFNNSVAQLEQTSSDDLDEALLADVTASPTGLSVRFALEQFYDHPNNRPCPSCGRPGLEPRVATLTQLASQEAKHGSCIICSKMIQQRGATSASPRQQVSQRRASKAATELQQALFSRIQINSRIDQLTAEESSLLDKLSKATTDEVKLLQNLPQSTTEDPLRIAIRELRSRQRRALRERDNALRSLKRQLSSANRLLEKRQATIARAFKKYATLYLDERCDIKFLNETDLPRKRGPQLKPPHSAFYPVISGTTRPSSQDLSDAQRSFVDLAFRMAVLDVWHQQTGGTATLVVETPEGAVDLAYMGRVAHMLRSFAKQGHTLIITTNLNNEVFLPELMASYPASERSDRILNLLIIGKPRRVQKEIDNKSRFERILKAVAQHRVSE